MADRIFDIDGVVARLEPGRHAHEVANRKEIDAEWARRSVANGRLFNGATVLATDWKLCDGLLEIVCRRTDYATLLHWLATYGRASEAQARALAPPGRQIHFFTSPVIVGSDGHALVARMAGHTYNAGQVYMPSGSFEPSDFVGGKADFAANMRREVMEETGLDLAEASAGAGYRVFHGGSFLALFRLYRFGVPAAALVSLAIAHLRRERDNELASVMAVAPGGVVEGMPRHVRGFMRRFEG